MHFEEDCQEGALLAWNFPWCEYQTEENGNVPILAPGVQTCLPVELGEEGRAAIPAWACLDNERHGAAFDACLQRLLILMEVSRRFCLAEEDR